MRARDMVWPLVSALAGVAFAFALRLGLGHWPNAVIVSGVLVVSIGAGLVCARFSRLGPFEGELGAPWFENDLRETLTWEYDRAVRYGRIVAIVVARQLPNAPSWNAVVRAVDRVIDCRNNWLVMVLPETTRDGARGMLRRLRESEQISQAAVVQFPTDVDNRDAIARAVLAAMRSSEHPQSMPAPETEAVPLTA